MKRLILFAAFVVLACRLPAAQNYADRFVWIFGWGLDKDSDVAEIWLGFGQRQRRCRDFARARYGGPTWVEWRDGVLRPG
ncbi:exported hypothetical protein [Verrucomicrobia bacterium]|nr:exported hypothetical protein [Verrucomicrobiota bacterium]